MKTLHTQMREAFEQFYRLESGEEYYWTVKDASNLKKLIAKITFSFKHKYSDEPKDSNVVASFEALLKNLPKWYLENGLEVAVINSKYSTIIKQIKDARGISTEYIEEIRKRLS